jgi:hypothetical protein
MVWLGLLIAARRNPVTGVGVSSSDYVPRRRIKKRGNVLTSSAEPYVVVFHDIVQIEVCFHSTFLTWNIS